MKPFSFLHFDEKEKEKEENRNRRKRFAGMFIMLMLLSTTFNAGYAAALSLSDIEERAKDVGKATLSAMAGIIVGGACLLSTAGFGSGACIAMGLAAAGATYAAFELVFEDEEQATGDPFSAERYATESDATDDTDNPDVGKLTDDANKAGYAAIQELTAKLRSDLVQYASEQEGSGAVTVDIYGPQSIYGFSAFPVQIKLWVPRQAIPFNDVHLRSVHVYVVDRDGNKYWEQVWDYGTVGSEGLNGDEVIYTSVLKGPDDLIYQIKDAIASGQFSRALYEQIWNATTREFEIHVLIDGYQEMWKSYPNATTQEQCQAVNGKWWADTSTCYVFDRTVDFEINAETTSAWKHVTGFADVATISEGMTGTLPVKFLQNSDATAKWVVYQSKYAGAISNFVIVTAATPVHVINSTANYKFIIAPNPGYFEPANPKIVDDFRLSIVRVIEGGDFEIADTKSGTLGELNDAVPIEMSAFYTDAPSTLDYHAIGLAVVDIVREDNVTIPVWLAAEPLISVVQNIRVVIADQEASKLISLFNAGDMDAIEATVNALINGIQEKIADAEQLKAKAQELGDDVAEEYATLAIKEYNAAISNLEKIKQVEDQQEFLNRLNAAKKHEQAGDFYREAARKQLNGDPYQAEIDAEKAKELSDLAKQYEPGFNLMKLFGEENALKFLFILIVAIILAAITYVTTGNQKLTALVFVITLVILTLLIFGLLDSDLLSKVEEVIGG